jgi:hypothetical protein
MRVVEGRQRADAHELARADADRRDAGTVVEVRDNPVCHRLLACSLEKVENSLNRAARTGHLRALVAASRSTRIAGPFQPKSLP